MTNQSITGRFIFPVDGPPLAGGATVIEGDKITAIHPHGTFTADVDLGNVAILPGLVNAHTHLDLTGLHGRCPPTPDFTQWLRGVIAHRRSQTKEQIQQDIDAGIKECLGFGTTLVGDIASGGVSWKQLTHSPLRAVVFRELLGLTNERARQAWMDAGNWLYECADTPTCRKGCSPHAPYSVSKNLWRQAACCGFPVAIHLAESRDELELLTRHTGPFPEFLAELGAWEPENLMPNVDAFTLNCPTDARVLLIHANYLPAITAFIPAAGAIVYCPRTHAAFGHSPHPFREFLQRGVRVALGTDSLASNPDLDILAEMRFIHERYPDFPGNTLLRMGTLSGAEALGWADDCGSLTPGKSADLAVVPLPNEEGEPHELLLNSHSRVSRTMFRGQWLTPS